MKTATGTPPRVLVVDDDASMRALFTMLLRKAGYSVLTATNGSEAVDVAGRENPALILMDMDMPVMDGYQATQAIRRAPGSPELPIIALTGADDVDAEKRCIEAGCTSYLRKPVTRDALLESVANDLRMREALGMSNSRRAMQMPPELLARFITERRSDLERAAASVKAGDFDAIARIGHQLKGSSGTLGFPRIGALGGDLERAARNGDVVASRDLLSRIRDELDVAGRAMSGSEPG